MRKYHHLGIPTNEKKEGEVYLADFQMHVAGYDDSPYGVEWMRFEPGCPWPEIVQKLPHIAFEVDDLKAEITGKEVIIPPNSPSEGVMVAFILDHGAPIELVQFTR